MGRVSPVEKKVPVYVVSPWDFMPYFHFRCVARASFDRNLIHSADACFLVMACVGYLRAQLKTLSSLLKPDNFPSNGFRMAFFRYKMHIWNYNSHKEFIALPFVRVVRNS